MALGSILRNKTSLWASSRRELLAVPIICMLSAGSYAIYAGQDANWDQRNYHFYSVYAWLHGRMQVDLAPGQVQTWINPLPHVHQYFLIRNLPPVVAGFVMGMLAGINGLLLWILTRRLLYERSAFAFGCAALVTVLGMTGSMYLSFVGTTFADSLCSPLILAALVPLLPRERLQGTWTTRTLFLCGLGLGLASGLKLTNILFALGMTATLLVMWPVMKFKVSGWAAFALGGVGGFLLCGGFWAIKLWMVFGNPVFPFFNTVFQSPLFDRVNFEPAYPAKSFLYSAVTYPFMWLIGMRPTSEVPFREARFALVAVLLPIAMIVSLLRSRHPLRSDGAELVNEGSRAFWLIALFFAFSYAIWLKQFGVQRYALPLELMAGLVVLLSLVQLLWNRKEVAVVFAVLSIFTILWTRPADWMRVPYGDDWFGVAAASESSDSSLYVMLSWEPISYAIPFMAPTNKFVRLEGNIPLEPNAPLGRRAEMMIAHHTGPIRTLSAVPPSQDALARLRRFGLIARSDCRTFRSRIDTFVTCGVEKTHDAFVQPLRAPGVSPATVR